MASGHLSQGPVVAAFEHAVAERLGRRGGVATSSGTAALAVALTALGVRAGDEVIVPAYACSALGDAVRFAGASVVLADVGEDLALDPRAASRRLSSRSRAVVVVHPFGRAVDLGAFLEWGLPVIEDCAQSLGASLLRTPAGGMGMAAVCSFYATKMVAAGEGGMVLADAHHILARSRKARVGGRTGAPGFNFKLSDLAAALGLAQLRRLSGFIHRRREIAARYDAAFAGTPVQPPAAVSPGCSVYSRYVVRVPSATALIDALAARGVEARPAVADPMLNGSDGREHPEAARATRECVSLPLYPSLSDDEVAHVLGAVREAAAVNGWAS